MAGQSTDAGEVLAALAPRFIDSTGALRDLYPVLERAPERLARPVRVAVVGQIKRGKSTLVNAILGRQLAVSDVEEATFRVNEFIDGLPERIEAIYEDDSATLRTREFDLSQLAQLTVRDPDRLDELAAPQRIVVRIDQPMLRKFELIDTPGLFSIYGVDSAETEAVLGGRRERVSGSSERMLNSADAVLYLFDRDLGRADSDVVARFLGQGKGHEAVGPMRALGVMSKCDQMAWPPDREHWSLTYNPIDAYARDRVAAYLRDEPRVARLFYDIVPVAALPAVGAQTMPGECLDWLRELAGQDESVLLGQLRWERVFVAADLEGCPLPVTSRRDLHGRLGPWGILAACRYLREGCDDEAVRLAIVEDSGVARLRALTVEHFGDRAYLIKLERILTDVRQIVAAFFREGGSSTVDRENVQAVRDEAERIADGERGLAEMGIRRVFGRIGRDVDEVDLARMYRVTEPRASCAERLGQPGGTPPAQLVPLAEAEVEHWSRRLNGYGGDGGLTQDALRGVMRVAEDVAGRVSEAAALLERARMLVE